jgi:DNA modification methylase
MMPLELHPPPSSPPALLLGKDSGPGVNYNNEVLATKPFFIKLLPDEGDIVLDPFGGSNTTGTVAEKLERRWLISETVKEYLDGSKFRFE